MICIYRQYANFSNKKYPHFLRLHHPIRYHVPAHLRASPLDRWLHWTRSEITHVITMKNRMGCFFAGSKIANPNRVKTLTPPMAQIVSNIIHICTKLVKKITRMFAVAATVSLGAHRSATVANWWLVALSATAEPPEPPEEVHSWLVWNRYAYQILFTHIWLCAWHLHFLIRKFAKHGE